MDQKTISGIASLREELTSLYDEVKNNSIYVETAQTLAHIAGKIITSAKVELHYNEVMENNKTIPFLEQ